MSNQREFNSADSIQYQVQKKELQDQILPSKPKNTWRIDHFAQHVPCVMFTLELREHRLALTYISPAVQNIFGISVSDSLADFGKLQSLITPPYIEEVLRLLEFSCLNLSTLHTEFRIQHTSKGERWLECHAMPETLEGDVIDWHGFITDITERKIIEKSLADREQELRSLAQNLPDSVVRYDRNCHIVYANTAFERFVGTRAIDILGKTPTKVPQMPEGKFFEQRIKVTILSGVEEEFEHLIEMPNGTRRWSLVHIVPEINNCKVTFVQMVVKDITERKMAERYLKQTSALQTIPDLVWLKDIKGAYIACNHAFEKFFGATEAQIIGKTDYDFVDTEMADFFRQKDLEAMATDHACIIEEWVTYSSDSSRVLLEIRKLCMHDEDGKVMGILGIGRDITEHWRMQKALEVREHEFRTLIENAPDNIIRYGLDTRIRYLNPALQKTLDRTSETIIGLRTDELYPKIPAIIEYQKLIERVIATSQPEEYLMVTEIGDFGRPLYDSIRVSPEFSPEGKVIGAIAIGRDLTRQHQLEMELVKQEHELRTLVDNTPDVIIRYDRNCRRSFVSRNYEKVYGIPVSQVVGKKPSESWGRPRMEPKDYEARLLKVMESGVADLIELDWFNDCREYVCQALRVVPELNEAGEIISALSITRDVSEVKRTASRLQARERDYRTLMDNSPEMVIRYNRKFRRIFVNRAYEQIMGFSQAEALQKSLKDSWVPRNISSEEFIAELRHVMESGEPTNVFWEWHGLNGTLTSHDLRMVPEYDDKGRVSGVLAIGHNITRLRQAEIVLRQHEQEFRALVENSPDTICRYDRDCRRIYVNSRMQMDTNLPLDKLLNTSPKKFPGGVKGSMYYDRIRHVLKTGESVDFELAWQALNGKDICSHIRLVPEFNSGGHVVTVLAVGRDITDIDAYRKQIHILAFYDNLTSLPNRALLGDRINLAIADAAWHKYTFGLMILDLDRFKEINDTLGHGIGDEVLREVAERLQECVRSYDTVARLGGDEFAILLPQVRGGDDLGMIAQNILDSFHLPFNIEGRELFVSTSIGIALYPDDSTDINTLFSFADSAMYHAKRQRNNFQFYSTELTTNLANRLSIESALRKALGRNELELYYQPQVELSTGRIIGAEALLRWNHSKHGLFMPDKFISVAEESGLIVSIGEWVLSTAFQAAAEWNQDTDIPFKVAVNLSPRQFIQNDLVSSIKRILLETQCSPLWVKLEITESLLLEDSSSILETFNALNDLGFSISIDDFGTGYSALSYLNSYPVSQIKIDSSFVHDVPDNEDKSELVKVIISIAQALRLDLVAEGVETAEQAEFLLAQGCKVAQGYLYGRPMQFSVFNKILTFNPNTLYVTEPI